MAGSWSSAAIAITVVGMGLAGCAKDVVLPDTADEPVCGNGILEAGEQCDLKSPGCVSCVIAPTWTCGASACTQMCGDDGVVGNGTSCESPRRDTACDLTGYWAVRETDNTRDAVFGSLQTSSNWYLYRLEQTGNDFHVTEELDCGVHVTGSATVDYTPGTLRGLLYRNRMDGASPHGARHGTSKALGSGCAVTLDRWYKVRGVKDSYLPLDFTTKPALPLLQALPSVADPVNDTSSPTGADDTDGDGIAGVAFAIKGVVTGVRNSAQRDWKEYATTIAAPAPASALTFAMPGAFDLEESILRVTECGAACSLLASAARPAEDVPGRITLSFIGKTPGSPRVSQVVAGAPRANLDADLSTCANVRLLLPHDPGAK
jgi:hypothetical protein